VSYPTLATEFVSRMFREVERATELFPDQVETLTLAEWLAVLTEEVGEVARDINDSHFGDTFEREVLEHLQVELVQVGAMADRMFAAVQRRLEAAP
jgi:NTP pyrophosphatase (non-canonical NTP hydrolase)